MKYPKSFLVTFLFLALLFLLSSCKGVCFIWDDDGRSNCVEVMNKKLCEKYRKQAGWKRMKFITRDSVPKGQLANNAIAGCAGKDGKLPYVGPANKNLYPKGVKRLDWRFVVVTGFPCKGGSICMGDSAWNALSDREKKLYDGNGCKVRSDEKCYEKHRLYRCLSYFKNTGQTSGCISPKPVLTGYEIKKDSFSGFWWVDKGPNKMCEHDTTY